jgi:hypothetical protein
MPAATASTAKVDNSLKASGSSSRGESGVAWHSSRVLTALLLLLDIAAVMQCTSGLLVIRATIT